MANGDTKTKEAPATGGDAAAKAKESGAVTAKVFLIEGDVPKSPRKTGYTRKGEIDEALVEAAKSVQVGQTVCIRQYDKKESASGTLYNLRKRQNPEKTNPPVNVNWQFDLGDLGQLDPSMEGKTGLFAKRVA